MNRYLLSFVIMTERMLSFMSALEPGFLLKILSFTIISDFTFTS